MLKILHLTGHLGGGVGTVVLNYLVKKSGDKTQRHSLIAFDSLNAHAVEVLSRAGIEYFDRCHTQLDLLNRKIAAADVVVLHWWNHPLTSYLMMTSTLSKCRLALWSHISGSPAPNNFTQRLFSYPDEFVFTTPLSYFDPEYVGLPAEIKARVGVIWSTAGVERIEGLTMAAHEGFNIGYVGNLDFTKIHPDFVRICQLIDMPNATITVIGPLNEELVQQVNQASLCDRVRFTGFISEEDKWDELSRFDVFGYPLAPHHYGTCDQTLQEAMAVGIVPVVLDNPMESYMVKNGKVGLVAKSTDEYVACIKTLYRDHALRKGLSDSASVYAKREYSLTVMSEKWDEVFSKLMLLDKTEKSWFANGGNMSGDPYKVFLESLGRYSGVFAECVNQSRVSRDTAEDQLRALGSKHNWRSDNKSTVHQYASFFPEDTVLNRWSRLMKGGEDNHS